MDKRFLLIVLVVFVVGSCRAESTTATSGNAVPSLNYTKGSNEEERAPTTELERLVSALNEASGPTTIERTQATTTEQKIDWKAFKEMMMTNQILYEKVMKNANEIEEMIDTLARTQAAIKWMGFGSEYFKQKHLSDDVFFQEFQKRSLDPVQLEALRKHMKHGTAGSRLEILVGKYFWLIKKEKIKMPPLVRFWMAEGSEVLRQTYLSLEKRDTHLVEGSELLTEASPPLGKKARFSRVDSLTSDASFPPRKRPRFRADSPESDVLSE
ncbi:hypothetical protein PsorP6_014065 [Peronosclerospora sorghi]|uniref:Uncharacterized protein n=1 Tax=Peronosclerospora sorghi TaxID=230839 RepID=A0ACC0VGE1_9STRA|nr:hypothetical protein PsorP6_014065 [Peronosclerospora sorghi]